AGQVGKLAAAGAYLPPGVVAVPRTDIQDGRRDALTSIGDDHGSVQRLPGRQGDEVVVGGDQVACGGRFAGQSFAGGPQPHGYRRGRHEVLLSGGRGWLEQHGAAQRDTNENAHSRPPYQPFRTSWLTTALRPPPPRTRRTVMRVRSMR